MNKIIIFCFLLLASLSSASADISLDTPQVTTITVVDTIVRESINFFNGESSAEFTASLSKPASILALDLYSVSVQEESYGSFSLIIDTNSADTGVYFNSIKIFKNGILLFNIPIVIVIEDNSFDLNHDVIIDFQQYDIDTVASEMILSPSLEVHKLDYDNPSNSAVLRLFVYSIYGNLLDSSEEIVAVSREAGFERFINLGNNPPEEVIIAASTESSGRTGFDISQLNTLTGQISLSPAVEKKDYSFWIYISVFVLLLGALIGLSYYWNNRTMTQAKDWEAQVSHIKKTQFSDSARALRKLKSQRDVLVRAYNNHFITKESYQKGVAEIDRLTTSLKKRL